MDSITQFSAAFGARCLCGSNVDRQGSMKIVKAKRILTGLPDDRKNFSCSQSRRGKKIAAGWFIIRSAVSLEIA
jgi:hypothetical protein